LRDSPDEWHYKIMRRNPTGDTMRRKQTGFTLVELMIVIVVLAVLATVAIPNLRQILQKSQVKDASGGLTAALMLARSEAVSQARSILVCITSSTSCSTDNGDGWEDGWIVIEPTSNTILRRVQRLDNEVTVTTDETDIGRVTYRSDGSAQFTKNSGASVGTNVTKSFTFANTCWSKDLDITATGRVDASAAFTPLAGCQ